MNGKVVYTSGELAQSIVPVDLLRRAAKLPLRPVKRRAYALRVNENRWMGKVRPKAMHLAWFQGSFLISLSVEVCPLRPPHPVDFWSAVRDTHTDDAKAPQLPYAPP